MLICRTLMPSQNKRQSVFCLPEFLQLSAPGTDDVASVPRHAHSSVIPKKARAKEGPKGIIVCPPCLRHSARGSATASPNSPAASITSGNAANPTHAPAAASSLASPCPSPWRRRRANTAHPEPEPGITKGGRQCMVIDRPGCSCPGHNQPGQQQRQNDHVRQTVMLDIDPGRGKQRPTKRRNHP